MANLAIEKKHRGRDFNYRKIPVCLLRFSLHHSFGREDPAFEREDFLERLGDDGFDLGRPALFVWEGVTAYLTESAIEATLSRVARCDPGTVLIFDYIGKRMVAGVGREIDRDMNTLVASLGEPFRWGTHDPLPICAKAGFRHVRAVNFDQICLSLHGDYVRERTFRFVGIAMASRSVDLDP